MPRLSKNDSEQVMRALQHLLSQADAPPDRDELLRILNRLSQRTAQAQRREVVKPPRHRHRRPRANTAVAFASRQTVEQVEEGLVLAPKFDQDGLLPCVTTDAYTGEVLMLGYMNGEALDETIGTGEAHYWSRSRQCLWRKGATSGLTQKVVEMRIDDDQDAVLLCVQVAGSGASCHVGYRSCFYRSVELGSLSGGPTRLVFLESRKSFDPKVVYGDAPNPTQL